jgi:hypothetical protein
VSDEVPSIDITDLDHLHRVLSELPNPDTPAILLCAGVPYVRPKNPELKVEEQTKQEQRNQVYMDSFRPDDIREAVKELTRSILARGMRLVFGAQEQISPLVLEVAGTMKAQPGSILIFQSAFFKGRLPESTLKLANWSAGKLLFTPKLEGARQIDTQSLSLAEMRRLMLSPPALRGAIFVGGMEGIEDEAAIFREQREDLPRYAIASTGSAAQILFDNEPLAYSGTLSDPKVMYTPFGSYTLLARRILDDMGIPPAPSAASVEQSKDDTAKPAEMRLEEKLQRRDHLQKIVTRMADNSFKLKGWCLTLVSALLGLALKSDSTGAVSPAAIAFLAIIPTVIFAALDAYYLALERGFRGLYDASSYPETITPPKITLGAIALAAKPFATSGLYVALIVMEVLVGTGLISVLVKKLPTAL